MKHTLYILIISLGIISCGDSSNTKSSKIKDLAFEHVDSAKEYSDLIIKAFRTNRDKVIYSQLDSKEGIDAQKLNTMIKTYTQAIGGKMKEWEYVDFYAENGGEPKEGQGYDYTWYDERGRIAVQINVLPNGTSNGFNLGKIEFRSRLEILESEAFPGGPINDYKKILSRK